MSGTEVGIRNSDWSLARKPKQLTIGDKGWKYWNRSEISISWLRVGFVWLYFWTR